MINPKNIQQITVPPWCELLLAKLWLKDRHFLQQELKFLQKQQIQKFLKILQQQNTTALDLWAKQIVGR